MIAALSAWLLACPAAAQQFDFTPGGPIPDAELAGYHVEMEVAVDGVSQGVMAFELWPEKAPVTVRNFLRYAAEGLYDGLTFHRVLRDFMVQGGDPTGSGAGDGKYGAIPGEFSEDPKYSHEYGVLSMARSQDPNSASCQFFVVCNTGLSAWSLDGQYASFGRLARGVAALEALANVPVAMGASGEPSAPTKKATIVKALVKQGAPESGEKIERPAPDLGGEPPAVSLQHLLIAFQGASRSQATRSKEEAAKLAAELFERAKAGEDFTALVKQYSDDPVDPADPDPGVYRLTNRGCSDLAAERAMFQAQKEWQQFNERIEREVASGLLKQEEAQARRGEFQQALMARVQSVRVFPRAQMVPAFGDVGFKLKVGEIQLAPYDPQTSPFGWHLIKRVQ